MYENFFLHYFLNYSGRKTHSTTPLRIHGTSSTYPPSKLGRKTPSTTPRSNSRNLIDYPPPLEIGPENYSINYPPPRIHGRNGNSPPQIQFLDPPLICSTNSLI